MQDLSDSAMRHNSRSLTNLKLQPGVNTILHVLGADKPEQCPGRLSGIDGLDIGILVHGIPIFAGEMKPGVVTSENGSGASTSFGAYKRDLRLNIWRTSKRALWGVDRHGPNEKKMSDGWRESAWLRFLPSYFLKSYFPPLPAVRSIAWLDPSVATH
jgi:hypothetical protein